MSGEFGAIRRLLILARGAMANSWLTADLERRAAYQRRAAYYRAEAGTLAADTQPVVEHEQYGPGVVVGVTDDGLIEVVFAHEPLAVGLEDHTLAEVQP